MLNCSFVAGQVVRALSTIDHPICVIYRQPCQASFLSVSRLILSSGHLSSLSFSIFMSEKQKKGGVEGITKQKRSKKAKTEVRDRMEGQSGFLTESVLWDYENELE